VRRDEDDNGDDGEPSGPTPRIGKE